MHVPGVIKDIHKVMLNSCIHKNVQNNQLYVDGKGIAKVHFATEVSLHYSVQLSADNEVTAACFCSFRNVDHLNASTLSAGFASLVASSTNTCPSN